LGCPKGSAAADKETAQSKAKPVEAAPLSPEEEEKIDQAVAADQGRTRVKRKKAAVGVNPTSPQVREAATARVSEKEKSMLDKELILHSLQSQFIYSTWTEEQRAYVVSAMKLYALGAGEVVFEQGQPAVNFFIVAAGEVEVLSNGVRRNVLGKGAGFGESALVHNVPRTATIKTTSETTLWGLDRDTFKHFIEGVNAQNYEENKQFINSIQIFQVLTSQQKEDLLQALQSIQYPDGSRVVTQGEQGEVLYIIREGTVVCTKDGKEIRRMGKGEFFGEQALLYGGIRTATITASGSVKLVSIGRSDLQNVLGSQLLQVIYRNSLRIALDRSETLRKLNSDQSERLIGTVRVTTFTSGQVVIPRGTAMGSALYVVLKGSVRRANGPEVVGDTFACLGEMELTRKSGTSYDVDIVVASESADIAILSRQEFETCIGGSLDAATQNNEVLKVLKRVQLLHSLPNEKLLELTRALRLREFSDKEVIVKQSSPGDSFFIIESGRVDVFRDGVNLRTITKHDYFGERSVLFGDSRTATIIAKGPVACWILEKSEFYRVIDEQVRNQLMKRIALQDDTIAMQDLVVVKALGNGMFGNVYLTTQPKTRALYALKAVSRSKIEKYNIKDNILLERKVLLQLDHTMILKLVKTYKDATHIYFLTEFVRGLDFFDVLRKLEGLVSCKDARFYTGCMMFILEHLHERDIIYRDLKPENIMIDEEGYMKLIDFGTAKIVQGRTYTIVGTPHYMAPEVIVGKGYGMSADYWSMGAILFECICGRVPFGEEEEDPYQIYEKILQHSISFPPWVKADVISQVRSILDVLLSKNSAMRTSGSVATLRTNAWFKGFNWEKLLSRQIKAPFVPKIAGLEDDISKALKKNQSVAKVIAVRTKQKEARDEDEPRKHRRLSRADINWDQEF